ncbi:hypothetical protein TWF696_009099 [Orbilia brochopaga]|uniref:Uncharacterized protein n=1 Tax=Orbilia brochopaga TaxID=3140254 RepID=A0AAV9UEU4_9PEZI
MRNWLAITALSSSILPHCSFAQIEIRPDKPRCYHPNGSLQNSTDYQPCNNVAGVPSMCCKIANSGSSADACLSNGLCSGVTASGDGFALWRESCTDPTWESLACLKICLRKGKGYDWLAEDAPITLCQDGTICCGGKVTGGNCCSSNSGFQLPTGLVVGLPPTSTSMTSAASSTSTSSASKSSTQSSQRQPSSVTSAGSSTSISSTSASTSPLPSPVNANKIHIAMGVSVPVVAVAAFAGGYFFWRRRSNGRKKAPPGPVYEKDSRGPVEIGISNGFFLPRAKESTGDLRGSSRTVHELHGASMPVHHVNVHEMQ